jgi:hypothetical protein
MNRVWAGLASALLLGASAAAFATTPRLAPYMPLHPGLYASGSLLHDPRDRSFTAGGGRVDGVAAASGGETRFPLTALALGFEWHFPLFEMQDLPFFSSRSHFARVGLQQVRTETRGLLAAVIAEPDRRLSDEGSGIGDLQIDLGSYLVGGGDWRQREAVPFALQLRLGVVVPFGVYDRNAPVSAGDNAWAYRVGLGAHARPWAGALLDAGLHWQGFGVNEEPLFGALAPRQRGDEIWVDLSLSQRLAPGWHLAVHTEAMRGGVNRYRNPRFSVPAPTPPAGAESAPVPGDYRDGGTRARRAGVSLYRFLGARWLAGLHADAALDGRSGEFDLPYENRSPAGCQPGASGCNVSPGESIRVDGLGGARRYASPRLHLSLAYQFGLGDAFPCPGCERSSR